MKIPAQPVIVLLAFAVGATITVGGGLTSVRSSPAVNALVHSRPGNWVMQKWLDHRAPAPAPGLEVACPGGPRIDLELPDINGRMHALSDYDGQHLLLNFWATWCGPCIEEMPLLDQAQRDHAAQGVQILGIAVDRPEPVRAWLASKAPAYPILLDEPIAHPAASSYGNTAALLPYSVLISRDGTVLKRKFGAFDADELAAWLKPEKR